MEAGILPLFRSVEDTEALNSGFSKVGDILERKFFEAVSSEDGEFLSREWPGHLPFGVGRLAAACNDEQEPAWVDK